MSRGWDPVKVCPGRAEDQGDERQLGNLTKQREAQITQEYHNVQDSRALRVRLVVCREL